ncbi:HSF-type DNA-binding-domain-containing protein [Linnemannia elongata]|nr:HSF-type DNA-binding-domain-containing protein [Linnemannia elongata]
MIGSFLFVCEHVRMVEDPSIQHLISWAKEGDMFYVFNCIELSNSILPKFFKHNNWQSFVRQLNMYGFHKKESTMNRRNPESQRWQFYHPDFQRDRPHLRSNIKRKSARSINIAPTFSRVMFDEKGPYIQQDYQTRPFNGLGGHNRSQSSNHLQDPSRHGHHIHGGPQGPGHFPYPGPMGHPHRQPHPDQRPPGPRHMGDFRQGPPGHPGEPMQPRDDKDHPVMHSFVSMLVPFLCILNCLKH